MFIKEVAELTGVTVRTLQYYDRIGLLRPSSLTEAGYRVYDQEALETLQQILFFRELDFPLSQIKELLSDPDFDRMEALAKQRELLILKRERLDRLIGTLDNRLKGEKTMDFRDFDQTEIEKAKKDYADEVKTRWGHTDAYAESERKTGRYSKEDWKSVNEKGEEILRAFGQHRADAPESETVQALVRRWQQHITDSFYTCTDEILAGLGEMYTADPRFTENIDKYGEGTAALMAKAIAIYCSK